MAFEEGDFTLLRDMVYQKTGLIFEDRKRAFFEGRVSNRLRARNIDGGREYYRLLRYQDPAGVEFQAMVETLTTNETYFFREFPQLQAFADFGLPEICEARRRRGDFTLNVWSACCSTGDEPYTLAIILRECLDDFPSWKIHILATDIDTRVLESAARAVYSDRAVKEVPREYVGKYFQSRGGEHALTPSIKSMVTFSHLNLMDRASMRNCRGFDFIFCRNALIYFDQQSARQVLSCFYDSLVPGGYIFLGHSESVGRISAAFEMVRLGESISYRRPPARTPAADPAKGTLPCQTASTR